MNWVVKKHRMDGQLPLTIMEVDGMAREKRAFLDQQDMVHFHFFFEQPDRN